MPENLSDINNNTDNNTNPNPEFKPATLEEIQQKAIDREKREQAQENVKEFRDVIDFPLIESKIKEHIPANGALPLGEEKNIINMTFNPMGMEMRVKAEIEDENGKKYTEYFTYDRNYRQNLKSEKDLELEFVMGDYGEQGIISSEKFKDSKKREDFQESLEEGQPGVVSKKDIEKKIEEAGLEGQDAEDARKKAEEEMHNGEQGNGAARMGERVDAAIGNKAIDDLKRQGQVIQADTVISTDINDTHRRGITYNDMSNTAKGAVDYVIITKKGVFEVKEGKNGEMQVHKTDQFYYAGVQSFQTNETPDLGPKKGDVLMSRTATRVGESGFAINGNTTNAVFRENGHLHGSEIKGSVEQSQGQDEQGNNVGPAETKFSSTINRNGYEQSYLLELYDNYIPQGISKEEINGIFYRHMGNGAHHDIKDAFDMTKAELNKEVENEGKGDSSYGDKIWEEEMKSHDRERQIGPQHPVD